MSGGKLWRNCTSATHGSSPGLILGFVVCVAILAFLQAWYPAGWRGEGDGAGAAAAGGVGSGLRLCIVRGHVTAQRAGRVCQLYFLGPGVSPRRGNNFQTQQLLGQGPAAGKAEGSPNHGSVGWKEFLEVKAELCFTRGETRSCLQDNISCKAREIISLLWLLWPNIWTVIRKPSLNSLF